jgi:hypothetical protein
MFSVFRLVGRLLFIYIYCHTRLGPRPLRAGRRWFLLDRFLWSYFSFDADTFSFNSASLQGLLSQR